MVTLYMGVVAEGEEGEFVKHSTGQSKIEEIFSSPLHIMEILR